VGAVLTWSDPQNGYHLICESLTRRRSQRQSQWLAIIDEFTGENLALEVARQFKAADVIDVLREVSYI
jgi:hypothetical protein